MTQPVLAKQSSGYGPRIYSWPPNPPHEFEVVSVTSAISGGLPKPFLVGWAAKMSAECAVDDHDIIGAMLAKGDTTSALNHIKGARYRSMNAKADRGTIVHSAIESYVAGKPLTKDEMTEMLREKRVPLEMWKSTAAMAAGVMEFLFDAEPEILWSEATVFSRTHGYAGTADLIAMCNTGGGIKPVVIDIKTSARIYDEVGLQLAAYGRADFVGLPDGTEVPILESGEPIEHGIVVRPTASGKYERADFALSEPLFRTFLACLGVTTGQQAISQARRP